VSYSSAARIRLTSRFTFCRVSNPYRQNQSLQQMASVKNVRGESAEVRPCEPGRHIHLTSQKQAHVAGRVAAADSHGNKL
jgi:hypothetical protein